MKKILSLALVGMLSLATLTGCSEKTTTWTVTCPWAASGVASMVSQQAAALSTELSESIILVAEAIPGDAATANSWVTANDSDANELIFIGEGMFSITSEIDPDKMQFGYDDMTYVENLYSAIFVMSADPDLGVASISELEAYMAAGNAITVGTNGSTGSEAFLAAALFGSMGYGDAMTLVPYTSAAEAAQAVSRGEVDVAISHQSQILETYNQGGVNMVCAFDEGALTSGPFAGLEGVGEAGYPYFRNRCFIMAPGGADADDVAELKALYGEILADSEVQTWLADTMILEVDTMSEADVIAHIDNVISIVNEYSDILGI